MIMTCYKLEFSRNFAQFRRFGRQQRQNELRYRLAVALSQCESTFIHFAVWLYCQRQNCSSPLNVLFGGV